MNGKAVTWLGSLCVVLSWIGVSIAGDTTAPDRTTKQPTAAESARLACINQCDTANGTCNSEVRQARQACSRNAANSGRDPMTMRNNDYTYFCSYFRNRRGPTNLAARFSQHYDVCIDVMEQNIASMRYDCYRNERDAQSICRTELRECQAACQ